jgi:cation transport ATPase
MATGVVHQATEDPTSFSMTTMMACILLSPAVGAVLMSASTVIVGINAQRAGRARV